MGGSHGGTRAGHAPPPHADSSPAAGRAADVGCSKATPRRAVGSAKPPAVPGSLMETPPGVATVTLAPWEVSPTHGPQQPQWGPKDGHDTARSPGTPTLPDFSGSQALFLPAQGVLRKGPGHPVWRGATAKRLRQATRMLKHFGAQGQASGTWQAMRQRDNTTARLCSRLPAPPALPHAIVRLVFRN